MNVFCNSLSSWLIDFLDDYFLCVQSVYFITLRINIIMLSPVKYCTLWEIMGNVPTESKSQMRKDNLFVNSEIERKCLTSVFLI